MALAVGLRASVRAAVSEPDTAVALGSGDVPVLGTPRLLALAEAATVAAVTPQLAPGETTVGTSVTLEHRRASPVGSGLVVEAELTEVDGRRLVFSFIAWRADMAGPPSGDQAGGDRGDGEGLVLDEHVVGAGTIERVVVSTERFLARARDWARPGAPGQTPVVERG
jgi:fluoroacetyl-CoA thioesterase